MTDVHTCPNRAEAYTCAHVSAHCLLGFKSRGYILHTTTLLEFETLPQGDLHAAPTFTQSFVNGQHVGRPVLSQAFGSAAHEIFEAVRQCLASGQQYSLLEQAGGATQSAPGLTQSLVTGQQTGKSAGQDAADADFDAPH